VLISAAAGGVGTALVQIARNAGCEIFAMVGSDSKANLVTSLGASVVINYKKENPWQKIRRYGGAGPDVVFDSLGGDFVRNGIRELNKGGKMVCFGGAQMASASNILAKIRYGLSFGFYHPAQLMMQSKSLIGVNMLRIADYRPEAIQRALNAVIEELKSGKLHPVAGTLFDSEHAADAHALLESGNSTGKIAFSWVK
jgi:NADPH2:quinone reductase